MNKKLIDTGNKDVDLLLTISIWVVIIFGLLMLFNSVSSSLSSFFKSIEYTSATREYTTKAIPEQQVPPIPYFDTEKWKQYTQEQAAVPQRYNNWKDAQGDYEWKLDLIKEQTTRLDMLNAAKVGVKMGQEEYELTISALRIATEEFVKRNTDSAVTGNNYIWYLNDAQAKGELDYDWYKREYDRVTKNRDISSSDIDKAINNYNREVDNYNSVFVYKN